MLTEADVRRLAAEIDYYENVARHAARHYPREARKAAVWSWFKRIIDGDGFFIVTGALIAADLCLLIALVRS